MLPCDICGKSGHSWFDCPKRSTMPPGWKPERLRRAEVEVRIATRQRGKSAYVAMMTEAALNAGKTVAIIKPDGAVEVRGPGAAKDITPKAEIVVAIDPASPGGDHDAEMIGKVTADGKIEIISLTHGHPRKPGRPKSIEDMRAYKARKQREYRQRKAAEKEAGK